MKKDKSVYIRHIYDCIARIEEYVRDGKEAFFRDRETQDAVIRNAEAGREDRRVGESSRCAARLRLDRE